MLWAEVHSKGNFLVMLWAEVHSKSVKKGKLGMESTV